MFRLIVAIGAGALISASISGSVGASGPIQNPIVSPRLPGIFVGYSVPNIVKHGQLNRYELYVTSNRIGGVKGMKVHVYLPGISIKKVALYEGYNSLATPGKITVPGGLAWISKRLPQGGGATALLDVVVTARTGANLCDRVVVSLGGKSATYSLPCTKVTS